MSTPGFVVLYRWRLKPGHEHAFSEAWSMVTEALLRRGSLGSRLHRGNDGVWYGYAQWPDAATRSRAFTDPSDHLEASAAMESTIDEHFPEVILDVVADFLAN